MTSTSTGGHEGDTQPASEPGATPTAARSVAPDLARGGMLLLIAVANVHLYLYGHSLGIRGYPRDPAGADRVVTALQLILVDGRAYPLFGLLFGYGVVQLARRRSAAGGPSALRRLVRRRGGWMVAIGFVHGLLLFSGDIVAAYGILAVLMAGLLLDGSDRRLLVVGGVGAAATTVVYAGTGLTMPGDPQAFLHSMELPSAGSAAVIRLGEWATVGVLFQAVSVFGAAALGAWAARRRMLDEPHRYRRLFATVAVSGLAVAVLGGMPLALMAVQTWTSPPLWSALLAGSLHAVSGYAGGLGYAALFGLIATWAIGRGGPGPVGRAVSASGQRSLSCYLAQSVVFVALLPAWTLGLGEHAELWQTALLAVVTWAVTVVAAALSARLGYRGPAELLLRRLTYGTSSTR